MPTQLGAKPTVRDTVIQMAVAIFGIFLFAFGVNVFIVPAGFYNGGFVGISQLIRTILTDFLGFHFGATDVAGIIHFIFNIPLFFLAYSIGRRFFLRTVVCVGLQTLFLTIIKGPATPILDEPLAACCIGCIIVGVGTGITLRAGASGGGNDILGVYFTRKNKNFSVGKITLMVNMVVYVGCAFLFDIRVVIYSIIYAAIVSFATDKTHLQNINTEVMIFSKDKAEEIRNAILTGLGRGSTCWTGYGGYTGEQTTVIYAVVSKYELISLKKKVQTIDEHAFVVSKENISVEGNYSKRL